MKRFITIITLFFFSISTLSAQQAVSLSTASAAYCPYTFTRDLKTGSTGPDVKVLQQILNSDQRTVIAASGVASPGQETTSYGVATREAVKKFQALFIEYIGVANGVFGPKTRTVMNAVCNGEYYTSGKGQVYSGVSTQNTVNNNMGTVSTSTASTSDTVAPQIYLRSNSTAIAQGVSFRIIVTASEPIQAFTPESIIIEGGSVSDIRKLSPNSYSLLVTPAEGAKAVIAQVEADRVYDLAGNKNDNASNEIRISVTQVVTTTTTTTPTATITTGVTSGELDSIFNRILAQVTPATATVQQPTTCNNGATNPPYCNNQYSQQTPNYSSGSNNGQNQQNSLMNMLLLSKLLGGNNSGGGLFGNLFGGDNKQPQNAGYTGAGGGTAVAGPSVDIQACANGDKSKCAPTTGGGVSDTPGADNEFKGGKIEKIYACAALAPALSGETSQLKNITTNRQMFLSTISTKGSKVIAQYSVSLNDQQEAPKKVSENACYLDNNITKKSGGLICCKQVQYNATGQRYTCVPHDGLGQNKPSYEFPQKVDFSNKNCSVGSQAFNSQATSTNNTPKQTGQIPAQQVTDTPKPNCTSNGLVHGTCTCPLGYTYTYSWTDSGSCTRSTQPDPMNPESYPNSQLRTSAICNQTSGLLSLFESKTCYCQEGWLLDKTDTANQFCYKYN